MKTQKKAFRLSGSVRPHSYDVTLTASPDQDGFHGEVHVALTIGAPAATITLHARDLAVSDAVLTPEGAAPLTGLPVALDNVDQTATVTLPAPIAGPAVLRLRFAGKLNPSMHGLYLASDGHSRAVCSQCQATDARAIFPCFDEPEFKARLRWTLRAPKTDASGAPLTVLSNGPLLDTVPLGEDSGSAERSGAPFLEHRFGATRPVSSYLAAVAIGAFESDPPRVVNQIPLRVFSARGQTAQTRFATDFTARLLPWYESYFDYPYPYGKYDQVAVPGFDAGAMENVGLVLFRQHLLLMDPATASWRQEKTIALVVAHEFAHMWFGNLVTMRWWDDLWLNEAFAEWMAHKVVAALAPDYQVWSDFQDDKARALADDALPNTHPIWTPVETPEEAVEMFDTITYQKGCAVMRMLENFLGEAPFRDGLRSYMKAHAESNATGPDLWSQLEAASGQPVSSLMESWVAQPGFPLITIEATGPRTLRVSQRRFFSDPTHKDEGDQRWRVPLVLRYRDAGGDHEHRHILSAASEDITLPGAGPIQLCYGNAGEVGFYRVHHVGALGAALASAEQSFLSPVEQMGLLEDTWALLRSDRATIAEFFAVVQGAAGTTDHAVLRSVVDRLGTLDLLLRDSGERAARQRLRAFVAARFGAALADLGYDIRPGDPQKEIQRRVHYVHALASLARVPEVIAEAVARAERERDDPRSIDGNLAGTFVAIAARFGDNDRYDRHVTTYLTRKNQGAPPQESARYLYTLSHYRSAELADRTLALIENAVIPQEAVGQVLSQLFYSRHAQERAWDYLRRAWTTLQKRVGDMGLSRLVEAVGSLPYGRRAEIVAFFAENPPATGVRALQRALDNMDQREELRRRVVPGLVALLQ